MFLTRTSCCKINHTIGYYDAWGQWAVSVSGLPLTEVFKNIFIIQKKKKKKKKKKKIKKERKKYFQGYKCN